MKINILKSNWEPKGPPPPKIDQNNRLWMYQERIANSGKGFHPAESVFIPRRFVK